MTAEGAQFEVDDFLAHRLELRRVRDGELGRFFLEIPAAVVQPTSIGVSSAR